MKTPEEILQKHVPNRFPKDNPYVAAMEEYASQSKPQEIEWLSEDEIRDATAAGDCNWEDLNGFIEGAKWLQSELQTRIKPVDTKTVDAVRRSEQLKDLFSDFTEWHKKEYGGDYVEITQFDEYLQSLS